MIDRGAVFRVSGWAVTDQRDCPRGHAEGCVGTAHLGLLLQLVCSVLRNGAFTAPAASTSSLRMWVWTPTSSCCLAEEAAASASGYWLNPRYRIATEYRAPSMSNPSPRSWARLMVVSTISRHCCS